MAIKNKKSMYEKKCEATTRGNTPCTKSPMEGSKYCWHHRLSRKGGTPFYTNTTVQFFLAFILAIAGICVALFYGPTKKGQEQILDNQKRLFEIMTKTDKTLYPVLIKKYPLGYIIFMVDYENTVLPYKNRLSEFISIDSLNLSPDSIADKKVSIIINNLVLKKEDVKLTNITISMPITKSSVQWSIGPKNINMYAELLEKTMYGLIYVLGFEEKQEQ